MLLLYTDEDLLFRNFLILNVLRNIHGEPIRVGFIFVLSVIGIQLSLKLAMYFIKHAFTGKLLKYVILIEMYQTY